MRQSTVRLSYTCRAHRHVIVAKKKTLFLTRAPVRGVVGAQLHDYCDNVAMREHHSLGTTGFTA
jgi:hypothetical protein